METRTIIKASHAAHADGIGERYILGAVSPTINTFENSGETRATVLIIQRSGKVKEEDGE